MGFIGKPKLEVLYCDQEKYMKASIDEMWEYYPWIYDKQNGKLYKYDSFLTISLFSCWSCEISSSIHIPLP